LKLSRNGFQKDLKMKDEIMESQIDLVFPGGDQGISLEGEDNAQNELNKKISKKLEAYQTDLLDNKTSMKNDDEIKNYLVNWGKAKGIQNETDKYGNVIMKVAASKKYSKAAPTVIICPYDNLNYEALIPVLSTSLYTIKKV